MRRTRNLIRPAITALIVSVFLTASCSGRKSKTDHRNLIPENLLTDILTDVHLTDGLLTLPKIRYMVSNRDSTETHMEVIGKYGYTITDLDRTLKHYFIKRPKKLIRIYDKVLGRLSEMESILMNEASMERMMMGEIWPGEVKYYLPDTSVSGHRELDLKINATGNYFLTYSLRLYPDDQTTSPVSGLWLYHYSRPDSLRIDSLPAFPLLKDGRAYIYTVTLHIPEISGAYLRGWFTGQTSQHPSAEKHMSVEKISLRGSRIQ